MFRVIAIDVFSSPPLGLIIIGKNAQKAEKKPNPLFSVPMMQDLSVSPLTSKVE
jgi:hypothetical protein